MILRHEPWGAWAKLDSPAALVALDRDAVRALGLDGGALWADEEPLPVRAPPSKCPCRCVTRPLRGWLHGLLPRRIVPTGTSRRGRRSSRSSRRGGPRGSSPSPSGAASRRRGKTLDVLTAEGACARDHAGPHDERPGAHGREDRAAHGVRAGEPLPGELTTAWARRTSACAGSTAPVTRKPPSRRWSARASPSE